jgi:hypothetical protein
VPAGTQECSANPAVGDPDSSGFGNSYDGTGSGFGILVDDDTVDLSGK